jgi:hypothetical protein
MALDYSAVCAALQSPPYVENRRLGSRNYDLLPATRLAPMTRCPDRDAGAIATARLLHLYHERRACA